MSDPPEADVCLSPNYYEACKTVGSNGAVPDSVPTLRVATV